MGTAGSLVLPEMRTPKVALAYARQYRKPPKVEAKGAEVVTNDNGDLDADGGW